MNIKKHYAEKLKGHMNLCQVKLKDIFKGTTRSAVFIEHLYQFEEPATMGPAVTVLAASKDGASSIYENNEILVTYTLSGASSFRSITITLDGSVIEELDTTFPGTYTMTLEPVSAGNHIITISALSDEGILASEETEFYVRRGSSTDSAIPEASPIPAPTVFAASVIMVILWAAGRSWRHK